MIGVSFVVNATADTCSICATRSGDCAACDGDGATRIKFAASDTGRTIATRSCDDATLNLNVAAIIINAATYTGTFVVAAGVEFAAANGFALNDERIVRGHKDARIAGTESLYVVCRAVGQDDGSAAQAGEACPAVAGIVRAING